MKKGYLNSIIKKSEKIVITQFNNSKDYLVTHKSLGNRIIINEKTLNILNLVDGKSTLKSIVSKYNFQNPKSMIDLKTANYLLNEKLGSYGVILNNINQLKKRKVASYLALSFTLVNEKRLEYFIKILSPFFWFNHYYKILVFSLFIVVSNVFLNYELLILNTNNLELKDSMFYLIVSGIVLFFHEFGHATACKKLGAEPGKIGFGFYLLSPVMFTDVSDIWKLESRERNYVNFAGLYIEILIALFLTVLYFFTNHVPLLIICSIILFSFFLNLNPLLRYDGYWILSDITNTPNLRKVSLQKLTLFFKNVLSKSKFKFSEKNIFLIIYAFSSISFIFIFLVFIIIHDPKSILSFPIDIYVYIKKIILEGNNFRLSDMSNFILPFLFYFIFIKFLISFYNHKLKQYKTGLNRPVK